MPSPARCLVILAFALATFAAASEFRVWRSGEIDEIIERIIQKESSGRGDVVNTNEWSVGLMGVTKIARDEFNSWTAKNYNFWTMRDPVSNREVGSYYFTNITLRYRCNWNVVQAVAAYNTGIGNVARGIYPEDYLRAVIPWYWDKYKSLYGVVERWRCHVSGAWMVRLIDANGKPPKIGI